MSKSALHLFGIFLMGLGMLGSGIIKNKVLGMNVVSSDELLSILDMQGGMTAAACALIFEALESCAVPIFALLMVEGFLHTKSFKHYLMRVLMVALVSEIPYNMVTSGKLIATATRNPVFGIVLSLIVLYLYKYYEGNSFKNVVCKLLVCMASALWALMFGVAYGIVFLLTVNILWFFKSRPSIRIFLAAAALVCCSVTNPLYMFSPFGFLAAYLYNEEEGKKRGKLSYMIYPILLSMTVLAGYLLF